MQAPFLTLSIDAHSGAAAPADAWTRALAGLDALARSQGHALRARPVEGGMALALGAGQADLGLFADGGLAAAEAAVIAGLEAVRPRAADAWTLVLTPAAGAPIRLAGAKKARAAAAPPARMTVVGELARVDFGAGGKAGKLGLKVPAMGRTIAGPYPAALEVKLLKHRRKVVRLTGLFALDEAGLPRALVDAADVAELDLAPVSLDRFETAGGAFAFDPPLLLRPALDAETGQLLRAEDPLLELAAEGETREALEAALREAAAAAWPLYSQGGEPALARRWRRRVRLDPGEAG